MTVMLAAACFAAGADANNPSFSRAQIEFYEKQVQPILSENCYKCHSHLADKIKGGFVLDSRAGLLKGGETGPAIVPGAPEKSLLIKAVRHEDEELQMPPKKKLADEQILKLAEWVKMGAPYSEGSAGAAMRPRSKKLTDEDRKWWAFQPVREVKVPKANDNGWARNPIDKFTFNKSKGGGARHSPEAERQTLIRRVYFDVTGLPPTAEEVERFVSDRSPRAYEKTVDALLGNPHYGEKWARHWLDLVRYAESDGYKADGFRPNAWRYRDYVIRSFNEDKPYDRFLMEQLAADELWPNDPEALVGLGYLRLWIYEYNQRDVKAHWATILNDVTDVTGDAFLGLGLQCARCHDHKFDPILQRDYYRLQAFFAGLSPRDDLPLATTDQINEYGKQLAEWEARTADIRGQLEEIERPAREKIAKAVVEKFPKDIQAIIYKPASERSAYEQQIHDLAYRQVADEGEKLESKINGEQKEKRDALERELAHYAALKPQSLPCGMTVTDIGPVAPPTTIPKDKTQTRIAPGILTLLEEAPMKVKPVTGAPNSTGRRAALAGWLTRPDNPLTARVFVNRLWQCHFGRGIVGTPSDFGHLGEPPSDPELLDWLARFFVEHNWSIKEVHRLILTSATYRQAQGRQNVRRLESDQIRDAMLSVSGELDAQMGGPSVDASRPRRTVYTKWLRNSRDPLIDAFDPPDAYTSTPQRNVTTTPMQSLVMVNGPYVLQRAQALAARVQKTQPTNSAGLVRLAYRLAYGRNPTPTEQGDAESFLREQANRIRKSQSGLVQVALEPMASRSGMAAAFKPDSGQMRLQVPDNHLMPQYDFTIETFIVLHSTDDGASLRTIVSRWDGRQNQPGWSLGIAGKKSDCAPRSLVLELIGDAAEDGVGGYEAIPSGIAIDLEKPYYAAVTVRMGDITDSGVTFYVKELTPAAAMRTAHTPHKATANHQSNLPLVIGAREPEKRVVWDGLIDDVRLSNRALKPDELLIAGDGVNEATVGYWRFDEGDALKDSSPHGHNIRPEVSPSAHSDPETAALVDFCHALLNSNEFLYVD